MKCVFWCSILNIVDAFKYPATKEANIVKILLVDDEPNYCQVTKAILESTGDYKVEVSSDGDDGIKKAKTFKPDLILLDIMMSGKNGFEVAVNLKKNPETRSIPVIFISGILKDDFVANNKHLAGDLTFVSKTESPEILIETIENALNVPEEEKHSTRYTVRIVTYLPREHVDFLDKVGKDVLFAKGFKLSRSELLKQLVEFLQKLDLDIAELDLSESDLSDVLLKYCGKDKS